MSLHMLFVLALGIFGTFFLSFFLVNMFNGRSCGSTWLWHCGDLHSNGIGFGGFGWIRRLGWA